MQRIHVIPATPLPAHLTQQGLDYALPEGVVLDAGCVVQVPLAGRQVLGVAVGEGVGDVPPEKMKTVTHAFTDRPGFNPNFLRYLQWVADYTLSPLSAVMKMAMPTPRAFTHPPKQAYVAPTITPRLATLLPAQQAAADRIISVPNHVHETFVLDGVTGAGKTEIYAQVIAQHLAKQCGAQILVLLPEIALTHQWLARFEARFGFRPVVWHSGIPDAARRRAYNAIMDGTAPVVVGARSALFLPFANLSLIVVDEEHEPSYKQEDGVMYHARDMAVVRARMEQIPLILVSATPSLETQLNVAAGKYTALHVESRYGGAALPQVHLLDMRAEATERGAFISPSLREAVLGAMARGEQSLLFLNRRGYAPLVLCRTCGHRIQCPSCSAWLVLHRHTNVGGGRLATPQPPSLRGGAVAPILDATVAHAQQEVSITKGVLRCHHCGHREPEPKDCPACKSEGTLVACGPGVERVAEEVRDMLPSARVSVLSSDAPVSRDEIEAIIAGERDILIGTQMVAKGHHFPKLTTVGVIDADLGLQGGDLRASERSFQLLYQLSGRAGRDAIKGHVFLQTYQPEHPVMQALEAGDGEAFYALEREGREMAGWPPFGQLASLLFDGPNEAEVRAAAQALVRHAPADARVRLLGPAPAALSKLKGQYRYRVLVKCAKGVHLQQLLAALVAEVKLPRRVRLKVDVNPYSFV